MKATKFEFEYRFWIFGAIFFLGFLLYNVDHTNAAVALLRLFNPSLDMNSARAGTLVRIVFGIGAFLVFLAAAVRTWATAYLRTEVVHDTSQHSESVVADGPFRYSRNPLYFGNIFLGAGIGLMASRAGWFFIVLAILFFDQRLILREEHGLFASGESYRRYFNAVPRLLPSLTPRVPASGVPPRWVQAFAGESLFWIFGIAMVAFTITLDGRISGIVFVAAFAVYFAAVYAVKRRAARPTM